MRGTPSCCGSGLSLTRFIPAYAGNALRSSPPQCLSAVHPRVCGERHAVHGARRGGDGSSPRMRGTLPPRGIPPLQPRFIPAYAGNANRSVRIPRRLSVHPRVCGERLVRHRRNLPPLGSSPRMRGTRMCSRLRVRPTRFIPAYAGNARRLRTARASPTVHPRVCGERSGMLPKASQIAGSSPRMRGTQTVEPFNRRLHRFIPAYAGNASIKPTT